MAHKSLAALAQWALAHRASSTAATIRELLLSLYYAENKCGLADVHQLDRKMRRQLGDIINGIGITLWDYEIRNAFIHADGEAGLRWFLEPTPGELTPEVVRHMLSKAR